MTSQALPKLPTEEPFREALKIYGRRAAIFLGVTSGAILFLMMAWLILLYPWTGIVIIAIGLIWVLVEAISRRRSQLRVFHLSIPYSTDNTFPWPSSRIDSAFSSSSKIGFRKDEVDYLAGAYLREANLAGANLAGAYLKRANLERANLERANLERANLRQANLERANLERANLRQANLERAYLIGANLIGAELQGANLSGANLSGANLSGAVYDSSTVWPLDIHKSVKASTKKVPTTFAVLRDWFGR